MDMSAEPSALNDQQTFEAAFQPVLEHSKAKGAKSKPAPTVLSSALLMVYVDGVTNLPVCVRFFQNARHAKNFFDFRASEKIWNLRHFWN